MAELLTFEHLRAVLDEYAQQAAEIYKYQISVGGHNASRELIDNVKANVVTGDSEFSVTLDLKEYWKYLEGGSKGTVSSPAGAVYPAHFPPPRVIEQWISVKPIIPRPYRTASGKTKIPSPQQLSWAISTNIEKYGQEPYPALATTKEELQKIFGRRLQEALAEDVGHYIRLITPRLQNSTK